MASLRYILSPNIHILTLLVLAIATSSSQVIRIPPYIIDYGNGTIVRDTTSSPVVLVPPPNTPQVASRDISIPGTGLRARVFVPGRAGPAERLPLLVYFHGGAFCIGSAFSEDDTRYLARVAARARVVALAVDYRLYPEHPVPAPYEDAWAALRWAVGGPGPDPRADRGRVFVGGDSAGANVAHDMAVRAGPGRAGFRGLFLAMPYFLGSERVPLEPAWITKSPNYRVWAYVCPGCRAGVDDPRINPFGPGAPGLAGLGCERLLVYTAEIDELRGRGRLYYERVRASGWPGQARWVEARGKTHVFHILHPDDPATAKLINDLSEFLNA